MQQEAPGVEFGKYTIYRKLAMGGMAELFLAKQTGLGNFKRTVVLKCILPHLARESQFVTMFLDEARVASMLNHPNIVQIYEIGEVDGIYYIAMEYIRGPNLKAFRKRLYQHYPRPHYGLLASVASQIAAGLHHAHMATDEDGQPLNIVHRDVSPTNLLMSYAGAIKLVDFGVAKATIQEHKTRAGMVKGKYRYMSPEQVLARPIDKRSDVYALGAILYELSTNIVVFGRRTEAETIKAIYVDPIMAPIDIIDGFPSELNEIIMKALERDRDARYDSAEQMRRDLEQFVQNQGHYYGTQEIADTLKTIFAQEYEYERAGLMGSALTRADYLRFASEPASSVLRSLAEGYNDIDSFPGLADGNIPDSSFEETFSMADPDPTQLQRNNPPRPPVKVYTPVPDSRSESPAPSDKPGRSPSGAIGLFPADIGSAPRIESPEESDETSISNPDADPTIAFDDEVTYLMPEKPKQPDAETEEAPASELASLEEPAQSRLWWWIAAIGLLILGAAAYMLWMQRRGNDGDGTPPSRSRASKSAPNGRASAASFDALASQLKALLGKGHHIQASSQLDDLKAMAATPAQKQQVKRFEQHIQCAPKLKTAYKFISAGDVSHAKRIAQKLTTICPSSPALSQLNAHIDKIARSPKDDASK